MKKHTSYWAIAVFSLFIGSQITEGVLLVPYWKSLSTADFYVYYQQFGPLIGRFYTILTVVAALIPISVAAYCKLRHVGGLHLALAASFFAVLFIACFYIYFKGANALFYQSALSDGELKKQLVVWGYWHWSRIALEFASLIFLIKAFDKTGKREQV